MKRICSLFLLFVISIHSLDAFELEKEYIKITSLLYPKLLFFNSKIEERADDGRVKMVIVHDDYYFEDATLFFELASENYKSPSKGLEINFELVEDISLEDAKEYAAVFLLISDASRYRRYIEILNDLGVMTFSASREGFKEGALFWVKVTNRTEIYLNKESFQKGDFLFSSALLKIVKVAE